MSNNKTSSNNKKDIKDKDSNINSSSKVNKCIKITSIIVLILSLLLVGVFSFFVSKALLYFPWWRGLKVQTGTPYERHGLQYNDVEFLGFDTNETIRGWWIPAKASNDIQTTIIVVHGSGRDRYEWFEQLGVFNELGLSTLVYDSIDGMGKSDTQGRGVGYSYREHKDVRSSIRYVKSQYPNQSKKVVLTGMSLGAGSVIIAASKDQSLVNGVISESSYLHPALAWKHNIYRYLSEDISNFFAFIRPFDLIIPTNPPQWLIDIIVNLTARRIISTGVNLSLEDTPDLHVTNIKKPILFIHATNDPVCQYWHSKQLYENANEPKELWTVESNYHTTVYHTVGHDSYKKKLASFLKKI